MAISARQAGTIPHFTSIFSDTMNVTPHWEATFAQKSPKIHMRTPWPLVGPVSAESMTWQLNAEDGTESNIEG